MNEPIAYFDLPAQLRPLRQELDAVIAKTLDNCSFCLGPDVAQFERDFAAYCGAKHALGFNSGTSALHVAMLLLNVKPGDEVISTPTTFVATSWAISYVGARPVYVDIDDQTFNLDPKLVEKAVTPRTKAILPVHLYGHPCDMDPLLEIARENRLLVIEDCAEGLGALYKKRRVGVFGDAGCFSFFGNKMITTGEGGMILFKN